MPLLNDLERTSKWTYLEPDLSGQGIVGVWPGSEISGSIPLTGGRLVLTDKALIFCPIDLSQATKVVEAVLGVGQVPGADLVSQIAGIGRDSVLVIPLENIAAVENSGGPSLFKPPRVRVSTKVGSIYEFGILAGTYKMSISKDNTAAQADFLAKIQPRLA